MSMNWIAYFVVVAITVGLCAIVGNFAGAATPLIAFVVSGGLYLLMVKLIEA